MTAIPQPAPGLEASTRIGTLLRQVAHRQWLALAGRVAIQVLIVLLTLVLAASLLFGFWQSMPVALRVVLAVILWLTIFAAIVWLLRPLMHKRRLSSAAFAIERTLPDAQERISSAVELSEDSDPRFAGSP